MNQLTDESVIGTTIKKIENNKHNIMVPICIRNQYYSKKHIKDYIDYALTYTKEDVGVLIVDSLQSINSVILDKFDLESALSHNMRIGDQHFATVLKYKNQLPNEMYDKVKIFRWKDAEDTQQYKIAYDAVSEEYENNTKFRKVLRNVVKENLKDQVEHLDNAGLDCLSKYLVAEMALFMKGAHLGDKVYDLLLYSEDSSFKLFDDIQTGATFDRINENYVKKVKRHLFPPMLNALPEAYDGRMAQLTTRYY